MANRIFECAACGDTWQEPDCTAGGKHGYEIACPKCGSMHKLRIEADGQKTSCGGHQGGHGGCCGQGH